MIYYQGDDIHFSIDIKQVAGKDTDWSNFTSVVVYLYTHQSYIVKFKNSYDKTYQLLAINKDKTTFIGKLTPEQTRMMKGALKMSIRAIDNLDNVSTKDINTGIRILPTPIKYE